MKLWKDPLENEGVLNLGRGIHRTTNYDWETQKNTAKCTFPVQSAIEVFISTANCELRNAKKHFKWLPSSSWRLMAWI